MSATQSNIDTFATERNTDSFATQSNIDTFATERNTDSFATQSNTDTFATERNTDTSATHSRHPLSMLYQHPWTKRVLTNASSLRRVTLVPTSFMVGDRLPHDS